MRHARLTMPAKISKDAFQALPINMQDAQARLLDIASY